MRFSLSIAMLVALGTQACASDCYPIATIEIDKCIEQALNSLAAGDYYTAAEQADQIGKNRELSEAQKVRVGVIAGAAYLETGRTEAAGQSIEQTIGIAGERAAGVSEGQYRSMALYTLLQLTIGQQKPIEIGSQAVQGFQTSYIKQLREVGLGYPSPSNAIMLLAKSAGDPSHKANALGQVAEAFDTAGAGDPLSKANAHLAEALEAQKAGQLDHFEKAVTQAESFAGESPAKLRLVHVEDGGSKPEITKADRQRYAVWANVARIRGEQLLLTGKPNESLPQLRFAAFSGKLARDELIGSDGFLGRVYSSLSFANWFLGSRDSALIYAELATNNGPSFSPAWKSSTVWLRLAARRALPLSSRDDLETLFDDLVLVPEYKADQAWRAALLEVAKLSLFSGKPVKYLESELQFLDGLNVANPLRVDAFALLAAIDSSKGKSAEADERLKKGRSLVSGLRGKRSSGDWVDAIYYRATRDDGRELAALERAVSKIDEILDADDYLASWRLAELYAANGNLAQARDLLHRISSLQINSGVSTGIEMINETALRFAQYNYRLERFTEAGDTAGALSRWVSNPDIHDRDLCTEAAAILALSARRLGRNEQAIQAARQALWCGAVIASEQAEIYRSNLPVLQELASRDLPGYSVDGSRLSPPVAQMKVDGNDSGHPTATKGPKQVDVRRLMATIDASPDKDQSYAKSLALFQQTAGGPKSNIKSVCKDLAAVSAWFLERESSAKDARANTAAAITLDAILWPASGPPPCEPAQQLVFVAMRLRLALQLEDSIGLAFQLVSRAEFLVAQTGRLSEQHVLFEEFSSLGQILEDIPHLSSIRDLLTRYCLTIFSAEALFGTSEGSDLVDLLQIDSTIASLPEHPLRLSENAAAYVLQEPTETKAKDNALSDYQQRLADASQRRDAKLVQAERDSLNLRKTSAPSPLRIAADQLLNYVNAGGRGEVDAQLAKLKAIVDSSNVSDGSSDTASTRNQTKSALDRLNKAAVAAFNRRDLAAGISMVDTVIYAGSHLKEPRLVDVEWQALGALLRAVSDSGNLLPFEARLNEVIAQEVRTSSLESGERRFSRSAGKVLRAYRLTASGDRSEPVLAPLTALLDALYGGQLESRDIRPARTLFVELLLGATEIADVQRRAAIIEKVSGTVASEPVRILLQKEATKRLVEDGIALAIAQAERHEYTRAKPLVTAILAFLQRSHYSGSDEDGDVISALKAVSASVDACAMSEAGRGPLLSTATRASDPDVAQQTSLVLARSLIAGGQLPEAEAILDESSLKSGPNNLRSMAARLRGVVRLLKNDIDGARSEFSLVWDRSPESAPREQLSFAHVLTTMGRFDDAKVMLVRLKEAGKQDASEIAFLEARLSLARGDGAQALESLAIVHKTLNPILGPIAWKPEARLESDQGSLLTALSGPGG